MTVDWWGDLAVESCAGVMEAAISELYEDKEIFTNAQT